MLLNWDLWKTALFDVKVDNVTTATQKGKTKRNRFGIYKKSDYKKVDHFVSKIRTRKC